MTRGQEDTSTNQVWRKRGPPWEMLTASSLVTGMSVEELRSFSQVLVDISLELSDDAAALTIRGQIMLSISPASSFLLDFASLSRL